jgi:NADPH-dependent 7-cyano-7-deazaguanine reductase QueF
VDEIIPEPLGGAHTNLKATAATMRAVLIEHLGELTAMSPAERLKKRYEKFRAHGHFLERAPTPAEKAAIKKASKKTTQVIATAAAKV